MSVSFLYFHLIIRAQVTCSDLPEKSQGRRAGKEGQPSKNTKDKMQASLARSQLLKMAQPSRAMHMSRVLCEDAARKHHAQTTSKRFARLRNGMFMSTSRYPMPLVGHSTVRRCEYIAISRLRAAISRIHANWQYLLSWFLSPLFSPLVSALPSSPWAVLFSPTLPYAQSMA
jgi:hypothetical protein